MNELKVFEGLSAQAYEHPATRAAVAAVEGGPRILHKVVDVVGARRVRSMYLAGSLRVSAGQFPDLQRIYLDCCRILDMQPPELYVARNPVGHTGALGAGKPFIVLSTAVLKLIEEDEPALRFMLGRELGHALAGHALYNSALSLLDRVKPSLATIPVAGLLTHGATALLRDWQDKAEFSADRAGLLCCQGLPGALTYFMRMASGYTTDLDEKAFLSQEVDYENNRHILDSILKLLDSQGGESPKYLVRYRELQGWVDSGAFQRIMDGVYQRGGAFSDDAKVTVDHYKGWVKDRRRSFLSILTGG